MKKDSLIWILRRVLQQSVRFILHQNQSNDKLTPSVDDKSAMHWTVDGGVPKRSVP